MAEDILIITNNTETVAVEAGAVDVIVDQSTIEAGVASTEVVGVDVEESGSIEIVVEEFAGAPTSTKIVVDHNASDPNQHTIGAITGLSEELANLKRLKTLYSDSKYQANYFMWDDVIPANPVGLFVTMCDGVDKIKVCQSTDDVFGVTVPTAAFIGGQDDVARDGNYGLVINSGIAYVQCESDVAVGDYVVPNDRGEAQKSGGNHGYLVTGLSELNGIACAVISLTPSTTLAHNMADNVEKLEGRMDMAEQNITSVGNVANTAYTLAKDAKENAEINSETLKEAITEVLGKMDEIDIDNLNQSVNNVCELAAQATTIAENAVSAAQKMGDDAYASANEAIAAIKDMGAGSTTWAKRLDAYSVGEYSQGYGLTWEQAKAALNEGLVYIPTQNGKETYVGADDVYEREFYKGYYYTWNGEQWDVSETMAVNFSSVYIIGSAQAPYWVVTDADVENNGVTYKLDYLYKWENGAWDTTGISVTENTLTRAVSAMHQTANELSMEVSNVRGDVAAIEAKVDENESTVQTLAQWTGSEEGKYNIATTKVSADDDGASIALVVVRDGVDEELGGARIVLNDSEKGSHIQLDADVINFTAEHFQAIADEINMDGYVTFTDLATDDGTTIISGGNIETDTLSAITANLGTVNSGNIQSPGYLEPVVWENSVASSNTTVSGPAASTGLAFKLNDGNTSYSVSGIGSCEDTVIVIPSTHEGLPVTQIATSAFSGNKDITSVTIPNSITIIKWGAFWKCSNLKSVVFEEGSKVTYIGGYAFHSCTNLIEITIPSKVVDIREQAFYDCRALEKIYFNAANMNDLPYTHQIRNLLSGTKTFEKATLVNGANIDGRYEDFTVCYYDASGLTGSDEYVDVIKFNDTIQPNPGETYTLSFYAKGSGEVNTYLWNNDEGVVQIASGESSQGKPVTSSDGNCVFDLDGEWKRYWVKYTFKSSGTVAPKRTWFRIWGGNSAQVYICGVQLEKSTSATNWTPSKEDYGVSSVEALDNRVFYNAGIDGDGIEVVVSSNVTKIPAYLFCPQGTPDSTALDEDKIVKGIPKIASIKLENRDTALQINKDVFYGHLGTTLKEIHVPNIKTWCLVSFADTTSNPLMVAGHLYCDGELVTNLIIPEGITKINSHAFRTCHDIVSVVIPDSVVEIGLCSFNYCMGIKDIILGKGIKKITYYAFNRRNSNNVIVPFDRVYYKGTETDWNNINFPLDGGDHYNHPLTDAPRYYYSETTPIDSGNYWHYKDGFKISCNDANMIDSKHFKVTQDGEITATAGEIGGCKIENGVLQVKAVNIQDKLAASQINADGITAENVDISGKIAATEGKIGGFDIDSDSINSGTLSITDKTEGVYIGLDGINVGGGFVVEKDGSTSITKGTIQIGGKYSNYSAYSKITDTEIMQKHYFTSTDSEMDIYTHIWDGSMDMKYLSKYSALGENIDDMLSIRHAVSEFSYNTLPGFYINGNNILIIGVTDRADMTAPWGQIRLTHKEDTLTSSNYLEYGTWYGSLASGSDRDIKNTIEALNPEYDKLFDNLNPVRYKYNQGNSGRFHTGFIAQEVEEATINAGLTTQDFAAFIRNNEEEKPTCYIRYEEIIALCVDQIQKLKVRVAELENKESIGEII